MYESAIKNEENHEIIPHLRCSSYYKAVQIRCKYVPNSEIYWRRSFGDRSFEFATIVTLFADDCKCLKKSIIESIV